MRRVEILYPVARHRFPRPHEFVEAALDLPVVLVSGNAHEHRRRTVMARNKQVESTDTNRRRLLLQG